MNEISAMPKRIVEWLSGREELESIKFLTEFPPVKKAVPLRKITVAVGFEKITVTDTFEDSENNDVLEENDGCRQAEITLRFSIHAPYSMGGEACHSCFADIIDCLTFDSGLNIISSGCGKMTEDRQTDALVLTATATVKASLCPASGTDLEFPSFLDKNLLCGSHIRNTDIHLSPEQQTFLNMPVACGRYTGTGATQRNLNVGFSPSAVFICAEGIPSFSGGNSYFVFTTSSGGGQGVTVTSTGFAVTSQGGFNSAGTVYNYAAFRG